MEKNAKYPIKYVSLRTGFSQNLIRTWENRYKLLDPERTETNRRLYSNKDIDKLLAIKKALNAGMKIGELSDMSTEDIQKIAADTQEEAGEMEVSPSDAVNKAITYIKDFKQKELKEYLGKQKIRRSKKDYITGLLIPILTKIGDYWESGRLRISQEHFASSIIREELSALIETPGDKNSPKLICCTPKGQEHDLIALAISALLSMTGIQIVFLGANVPAEEIIATAEQTNAMAVVLSIIYPEDDPSLPGELKKLDKYLKDIDIYIGGAASATYYNMINDSGIILINDINTLTELIKKSRKL
mgnify:CR=1 FL=1